MASVHSDVENNKVTEVLGASEGWLGITDIDEEGNWGVWLDGSAVSSFTFNANNVIILYHTHTPPPPP